MKSANVGTPLNPRMTEDIPDEPVTQVEVTHEDGTVRTLEGAEAQSWVHWVGKAVSYMQRHGGKVPEVEWEQHDGE